MARRDGTGGEPGDAHPVEARVVHASLRVDEGFAKWMARVTAELGLVEGEDRVTARSADGRRGGGEVRLTGDAARRVVEAEAGPRSAALLRRIARASADVDDAASHLPIVTQGTIGGETVAVVDAADLHAALGVSTRYRVWLERRRREYGLVEGRDLEQVSRKEAATDAGRGFGTNLRRKPPSPRGENGRPAVDHVLSLHTATELAMVERTPVGQAIRAYFIRCARRLAEVSPDAARQEDRRLADDVRAAGGHGGRAPGATSEATSDAAAILSRVMSVPGANPALLSQALDLLGVPATGDGAAERAARGAEAPGRRPGTPAAGSHGDTGPSSGRPPHLHETSVGVVIDLRLGPRASARVDHEAALAAAGCPSVTTRTLRFWRTAYHDPTEGERRRRRGATPQRGEAIVAGITLAMRRAAVEAYEAIRAERPVATAEWRRAEREALARDVEAASLARARNGLN